MHAWPLAVALAASLAGAQPVRADGDLCAPRTPHTGAAVDLDVRKADIQDVLRLLADVAKLDLVIAADVQGTVTLRLQRVPWDRIACTLAGLHRLRIARDGTVLVVTRR